METERHKKPRPPLDGEALERLALHYVGRYATTRSKLKHYLARKLDERGWKGAAPPDIEQLVERFVSLGYIDDEAFAAARASSLQRRGYGERRVRQSLRAAGLAEPDMAAIREQVEEGALEAALRFARRKRIGPFAAHALGREEKQKAFAAMIRAGHPMDVVKDVLDASPGDILASSEDILAPSEDIPDSDKM